MEESLSIDHREVTRWACPTLSSFSERVGMLFSSCPENSSVIMDAVTCISSPSVATSDGRCRRTVQARNLFVRIR